MNKISVKNGGFPPIKYLNPNETIDKSLDSSRSIPPTKTKTVNIKQLLDTTAVTNAFDDKDDEIEIKEF